MDFVTRVDSAFSLSYGMVYFVKVTLISWTSTFRWTPSYVSSATDVIALVQGR